MTKKELNDLVYAYHDDSPLFCVCSSINAISYLSECMYLANYLFAAELHKSRCDATFKFLAKCFSYKCLSNDISTYSWLKKSFLFKKDFNATEINIGLVYVWNSR